MLNNKQYFHFLLFFLILISPLTVVQAHETQKDHIEVFIRGKKYDSLHSYKREKLMKILKKTLPFSTEEDFNQLAENLLSNKSTRQLNELSAEEFKSIVKEAQREQLLLTGDDSNNGSFFQMNEMLQDYLGKHEGTEPIDINLNKVKTIIFKPAP